MDFVDTDAVDVLGPKIRFLSSLELDQDAFAVTTGVVPPGVIVPLHSHPDRELFTITQGTLEVFAYDAWQTLQMGDTVDVRDGVRHAWRNSSEAPAEALVVSTVRLSQFLREIGRPLSDAGTPPSPQDLETFAEAFARYGYWNGNPEDNAQIGLSLSVGS